MRLILTEGGVGGGVVLQEHRPGRPDVHPFLHGTRAGHSTHGGLRCQKVPIHAFLCFSDEKYMLTRIDSMHGGWSVKGVSLSAKQTSRACYRASIEPK